MTDEERPDLTSIESLEEFLHTEDEDVDRQLEETQKTNLISFFPFVLRNMPGCARIVSMN